MKVLLFKYSLALVYALSATLLALVLTATLLYTQRAATLQQNRHLILQNDSILSENIKLKNSLLNGKEKGDRKTSLTSVQYP